MKLVFSDARVWRWVLTAIGKVITEGVFVVDPEKGFLFRALDSSHVVMVDMRFPPESFEEFEVDERTSIGVNLEEVAKVLRRAAKDDRLELMADEQSLTIAFSGRLYREFRMPSLDITEEQIPEPQLSLKARVKVLSDTYREMIKDLEFIGDVVRFEASEEKFVARSTGELGEAEIVFNRELGGIMDMEVEGEQAASYSLDYFTDLAAAARVADTIEIRFSTDMPVMVEHYLPQGAKFLFLLAPRVD